MRDLSRFGSEQYPLRCSALSMLVRCPWRAVQMYSEMVQDEAGPAADTGSAVHFAIAHWHKDGNALASLEAMRAALPQFPLADLDEARLHFTPYTQDPRNSPARAGLIACEQQIRFTLDPAPSDPTGEPIHVQGTLDQVRRGPDGIARVWDVKTGKRHEGWAMLHEHAVQIAAYCIGASLLLKEEVAPGGIIRTQGYRVRGCDPASEPPRVFWHAPFGVPQIPLLLEQVQLAVAQLRSGSVSLGPGDWCGFCPAGGLETCSPRLLSLSLLERLQCLPFSRTTLKRRT